MEIAATGLSRTTTTPIKVSAQPFASVAFKIIVWLPIVLNLTAPTLSLLLAVAGVPLLLNDHEYADHELPFAAFD